MVHQIKGEQQLVMVCSMTLLSLLILSDTINLTWALEPLVETGVSTLSPEGKHVGVNVPPFFNMALDTRGPMKGLRMTQSVMSGLVRINLDRERGADGKFRGPIVVKVGGMTMYNNNEKPLENSGSNSETKDSSSGTRSRLSKLGQEIESMF